MHDDMRLFALILSVIVAGLTVGFILLGTCIGDAEAGAAYRITYYGDEFAGNPMFCTEEPYDPNDPTVVATPAGGFQCGTVLEVCVATCATLTVQDRCGGCGPKHIDVSESAWKLLGEEDYGSVEQATVQLPATGIGAHER